MADNNDKNNLVLPTLILASAIIFFAFCNRYEVVSNEQSGVLNYVKIDKFTGQSWAWSLNDEDLWAWIPMYEDL
jgi:hypothetical protein